MRLSFSTNAFVKYPVIEAVERIAAIGYEGIELLADAPHLYADSVISSNINRIRTILDRTGLTVANINANTAVGYYNRQFWEPLFEPSLANPDRDLREWRIAYSKKCIDMAQLLESPCVSLTSGRPAPGVSPEQSMRFLRESLKELLDYAEKRSVRIGIEYEPGLLIERCEELLALIEEMNSLYLGANLDLGHSHVLGEHPDKVINALSQKIFHIHLEDIKDRNYEDFVTVELYTYPHRPEAAAKQALSYLQTISAEDEK